MSGSLQDVVVVGTPNAALCAALAAHEAGARVPARTGIVIGSRSRGWEA